MSQWRLWDYVTEDGRNLLLEWYAEQDESVQARLDHVVLLAKAEDDWIEPEKRWFSELTKKHAGLSEFRFTVEGRFVDRKFRPVGLFRPHTREFIFILGCEKKLGGLIYVPDKAFDTAMKYKADLEAGHGGIDEHV